MTLGLRFAVCICRTASSQWPSPLGPASLIALTIIMLRITFAACLEGLLPWAVQLRTCSGRRLVGASPQAQRGAGQSVWLELPCHGRPDLKVGRVHIATFHALGRSRASPGARALAVSCRTTMDTFQGRPDLKLGRAQIATFPAAQSAGC